MCSDDAQNVLNAFHGKKDAATVLELTYSPYMN